MEDKKTDLTRILGQKTELCIILIHLALGGSRKYNLNIMHFDHSQKTPSFPFEIFKRC